MNIVHTEASTGWGGQEIRILEEARGMIRRGHQVRILAASSARLLDEAPRYGVPASAAPIARKNWVGLSALRSWLGREHRLNRIDVINTHSSTDSWLAALACATLTDPPVLVRTRHISAPVPNNWTSRWLYGRASRMIVTTGEALRLQLIRENHLDGDRIVSIPTGIDTSSFRPPNPAERRQARTHLEVADSVFVIGIVATLRSWKGHRYLIEAVRGLMTADRQRQVLLVIVGDGPQRQALEGQVAALGLDQNVLFAGNQTDVVPWLHALDVFVLPSYANEGVPQALLQAMGCGLPVVTTGAGAILEIARAEESALVVPMHDAAALTVALRRIQDDLPLRYTLSQEGKRLVASGHTLDGMLTRMEQVFRRASGQAPVTA